MQRIAVEDVRPAVSGGLRPAKAVVGEHVPVSATAWREGHQAVAAEVVWSGPGDAASRRTRMEPGPDNRWEATIVPDRPGEWTFRVEAWSDPWATWRRAVEAKLAAGVSPDELDLDLEEGARLLERAVAHPGPGPSGGAPGTGSATNILPRDQPDNPTGPAEGRTDDPRRARLLEAAERLRRKDLLLVDRVILALSAPVHDGMTTQPVRELVTLSAPHRLLVERERALVGSWYELFPRSTGGLGPDGLPLHGTFATAAAELDRVAALGFDVVYLPPIHPIGHTKRKGPNNNPVSDPGDVGSPWAIGSSEGGHDAVHPVLGTIEDFDDFVARARELGLEVALDLALQCSPDHPWVREHPEWFTHRPDGSIATAENPPKRYEDIYPLNFDNDPAGLYAEVLRVVRHWVDHGVRIFRVDNPHTKPPDFWEWLIARVHRTHPDVVFLAEAFTNPARLYGLARRGFSQSYTYFTWRTGKAELIDFGRELVAHTDEARPNLFVNTPDILPEHLQSGRPAMFAIRAALAATVAPTWGVYSGFELYEHQPLRLGGEEYLDSEKYQLVHRDFGRDGTLEPWIARLNEIRRAHPALRELRTLRFHDVDNDSLIAYSKTAPGEVVLVVVTLDPARPQEGTVTWRLDELGLPDGFTAHDRVTGQVFRWSERTYVRLDPNQTVAHIATASQEVRP
ncbi:alpha-1,4-glucan:maltose-1-phosphate maltosyltransferase [Saccharothrix sp. NRRL B-16348]|uniref:alpha-1,4-glucan--maltose-1-phosphate maltosyltransferase n=1 Tax=Saccharothrix sp. NRRL B-16348 TaxID=1415542 RepID=UPI0006B05256|nr:alpha-1,4-glucan--maltose-1-phosphate maltosyltransferase [Saccharothrix sp. NRRL B-16348]KOX20008.1 alpha-1,4-glucan:maltose-1-phosphate maltosyltransferase [Saccharothrix sp. NRRL B-16348]